MSRKPRVAIVLAIDCGKSMSAKSFFSDKSVFELSKQCLENIIRQKIFAETKNEYLLTEFSTNTSVGIKINGRLRSPNLQLLDYITTRLEVSDNNQYKTINVMDAIEETINVTIDQIRGQQFSDVKIALFSNFDGFNESDLSRFRLQIVPRLRQYSIQLTIVCDFIPGSVPSVSLSKSAKLALELMKMTESSSVGFFYDLKTCLKTFGDFEAKKTSPSAWYSNLQLGKGINALNIPIAAYIKAEPYVKKSGKIAPLVQKEIQTVKEPGHIISQTVKTEQTVKTNQKVVKQTGDETLTKYDSSDLNESNEVKPMTSGSNSGEVIPMTESVVIQTKSAEIVETIEKVIRGYTYGQTIVPIIDDNKDIFNYHKTEKLIKIIGFTSIENIDSSQRIGSKTMYVFADHRPKQSDHKMVFQALVSAMLFLRKVAIVRYGYSDRTAPQIGYLYPLIEDNNLLLSYIQLPFAEDVRRYRFPSLERSEYCPTDKQLEAIDSLIDSMDLMTADVDEDNNPCEAFKFGETSDPFLQHWFCCLYYRHLNQKEKLPQISDFHRSKIGAPLEVSENAVKPLLKILETFSLDTKKKSNKKKTAAKHSGSQLSNDSHSEIKRQRTDNQINDNLEIADMKSIIVDLINFKTSFEVIANKLIDYFTILFENIQKLEDKVEEIVDLIEFFRKESIESEDPKPFNDFMFNTIESIRGTNIWFCLLSKEIKPIGQKECPKSQLNDESIDNFISLSQDM